MTTTTQESTMQFIYLIDGEPHLGSINDIAHAMQEAHYAGVEVGNTAWTFGGDALIQDQPAARKIVTRSSDYDDDDHATVLVAIQVGVDQWCEASYRLDGRA